MWIIVLKATDRTVYYLVKGPLVMKHQKAHRTVLCEATVAGTLVTQCKHITRGCRVSFWLKGGEGSAVQHTKGFFFVYLNLGCSGLAGRPPMHCPVLHSPSPSLHAARWTDGPTDTWLVGWMDGWVTEGNMRESAEGEKHFKLENRATV